MTMARKMFGVVGAAVVAVALTACGGGGGGSSPALGGGGSTTDFCNTLKTDQALLERLKDSGQATNSQSESVFETALAELTAKAPSEIKGDLQTFQQVIKDSQSVSSEIKKDPTKASSLASSFEEESNKLESAVTNIEKFAKDKCGIDLTSSGSSDSQADSLSNSS
jgi:uncharacterized lipoprotein YehR (DUF1307 family)